MLWNTTHLCVGTFLLLPLAPITRHDVTGAGAQSTPVAPVLVERFLFDFQADSQGWEVDFADYPVGEEVFYELQSGHSPLPPPLDFGQGSLSVSGNNHEKRSPPTCP